MSTFDPVISPWLAIGSCIGFTLMFVGSLYLFPVKTKKPQPREHPSRRYSLLSNASQSSATGGVPSAADDTTPPSSPRPSSVSSVSTAMSSSTTNNTTTTTTTATTTTTIITTKSPASGAGADNRAHRTSTHLLFIESANSISSSASASSSPALSAINPATITSTSTLSPAASSALLAAVSVNSTAARPEVAIHSYASSQYDRILASRLLAHPEHPQQHQSNQHQHHLVSPVEVQKLDRDHPLVIIQRFKGILLTSFLVPLYLWWLFKFSGAIPTDQSFWTRLGQFLGLLGIAFPESIFQLANHIVVPLFLVGVLFMGPVLMMFLSNELPFQQAFDWAKQQQHLRGLLGIRNFVVGPVSEEFIFRACMVAIVAHSGASASVMIFGLPLVFGIAHIHHGYEAYAKKGRTRRALMNAALMACFQTAYTTLFGWFATFLFLRTSNLIAPCLCHAFCNMMGFPDVTNIQYFGRMKYWLYLAFVSGLILFCVALGPLTNPELYGDKNSLAYWRLTMGSMEPSSDT